MFIGNDIVSIKHTIENKHFLTQRYLDKLFTPSEQSFIWSTHMPAYAVWLMWTAKESAYKIYNKQSGKRMYHPKKFEVTVADKHLSTYIKSVQPRECITNESVQLNSSLFGKVNTPSGEVFVYFFPTRNFIHTLAAENEVYLKNIRWEVSSISSTEFNEQSIQVRQLAKKRIAEELEINPDALEIKRHSLKGKTGPPHIYHEGKKIKNDISITHDADLVAYAYL